MKIIISHPSVYFMFASPGLSNIVLKPRGETPGYGTYQEVHNCVAGFLIIACQCSLDGWTVL